MNRNEVIEILGLPKDSTDYYHYKNNLITRYDYEEKKFLAYGFDIENNKKRDGY